MLFKAPRCLIEHKAETSLLHSRPRPVQQWRGGLKGMAPL
jgi:hypothetical protein